MSIDLGYAEPPVPADLADRARRLGQRHRTRRRLTRACVLATSFACIAGLSMWVDPWHAADGGPRATAGVAAVPGSSAIDELTAFAGRGPARQDFLISDVVGLNTTGEPGPPVAPPVVIRTLETGQDLLWVTEDALMCIGSRTTPTAVPVGSVCQPLDDLPGEGLWGGVSTSPDDSSPAVLLTGVVRGPVSRVDVVLPTGAVTAGLAPTGVPNLGTFYWVVTDAYRPTTTDDVQQGQLLDRRVRATRRVVYRGDTPVFACMGYACLTSG